MKQTLGIVLIIGALALAYFGYTHLESNKAELKIGDLEIEAKDESSNQTAYIYFGLAVVCLVAGFVIASKGRGGA
jgi:hypothetical protein